MNLLKIQLWARKALVVVNSHKNCSHREKSEYHFGASAHFFPPIYALDAPRTLPFSYWASHVIRRQMPLHDCVPTNLPSPTRPHKPQCQWLPYWCAGLVDRWTWVSTEGVGKCTSWSGKLKARCSFVSDTLLGFTTLFIAAWSLTFFLLTLLTQMSLGRLCSAWFVYRCLRAGAAWTSVFTRLSWECGAHGCPRPFSEHKNHEQISRNNS